MDRQQAVEKEKLQREEVRRAKEGLQEIYSNCIRNLTQLAQVNRKYSSDSITPEEEARIDEESTKFYVEVHHWLLLLRANLKDIDDVKKLDMEMDDFVEMQSSAGNVRMLVLELARNDSRLKASLTSALSVRS